MKNYRIVLLILVLLIIAGCKKGEKVEPTNIINIINKNTVTVESMVTKGNRYFLARQFDIAKEYYEKALKMNNKLPEVHFNLALIYDMRYKYEAAIREYSIAINQKHGYVKAHLNLGLVLAKLKHYDAALEHIEWVLSKQPDNLPALYNRALVLHNTHSDKAMYAWKDYIELARGRPDQMQYVNKALLYLQILEDTKE